MMTGVLVRGIGSFYTVYTDSGEYMTLRCAKKVRQQRMTPLTGDRVVYTPGAGGGEGWLEEILPRTNMCERPPAANVDILAIVMADIPAPDLILTDRIAARAVGQGMRVILIANKADRGRELYCRLTDEYAASGFPVLAVSGKTAEGTEDLRDALSGGISCLAGQSGVGKTTLINRLLGTDMETGDISGRTERGRHTTRRVELLIRDSMKILDTPGFSLLEPEKGLAPELLKARYPEFARFEGACRFGTCLHDREPGCAVEKGGAEGLIPCGRLERYRELLTELRRNWRDRYA